MSRRDIADTGETITLKHHHGRHPSKVGIFSISPIHPLFWNIKLAQRACQPLRAAKPLPSIESPFRPWYRFIGDDIRISDFVMGTRRIESAKLLKRATTTGIVDVHNIAFANELSVIADGLYFDIWEAVELANRHPRVNILQPGPGVGGHCIAVDPWFIVATAPGNTDLIQAARKVNDAKPLHIADRVIGAAKDIDNPVIACLGLAYKADIDDLRQSPAVIVVKALAGGSGSREGVVRGGTRQRSASYRL